MKTATIVGLVCLFVFQCSLAAPFEKVIGTEGLEKGVNVSPTSDGGFIAVGLAGTADESNQDVYLVKTDPDGELLWSRTLGGAGIDNGWSVHEVADGFVIGGFTNSFGAGGFDFYLLKTNLQGELAWYRTFGGPEDDRCWSLAPTADGGFLLAGETKSFGSGEEDFHLVRTDSSGQELWSKTFGGELSDRCFAAVQADDGGFMLAGQTYSYGAGDRDAFVVKTDQSGEPQWTRSIGGVASDVGHSVIRTADGHYLVAGYTTSFATTGDDPYLTKISADNTVLWTKTIDVGGMTHTLTAAPAVDGGYYLTGFTVDRQTGKNSALVIRTDADGQQMWLRRILETTGGRSMGYTIQPVPGGGCVFAGNTTVGSAGSFDLLLVNIDGAE